MHSTQYNTSKRLKFTEDELTVSNKIRTKKPNACNRTLNTIEQRFKNRKKFGCVHIENRPSEQRPIALSWFEHLNWQSFLKIG